MTPGEELVSIYDEVLELTATAGMSGALQPQFVARMLGAAPADVVAVHSLRRRLSAAPHDLELAAEAERTLGTVRELLVAAEAYVAREATRTGPAPDGAGPPGRSDPAYGADADAAGAGIGAAELECLAFADAVDFLLDAAGVDDIEPDGRVDALAHVLRTPRERIRTVIDAHAAVTDPDVDPAVAIDAVRAARPVLDRLVDRAEHGDLRPPPPVDRSTDAEASTDRAAPPGAGAGPGGLDELSRLAREQTEIPMAGAFVRRLLIAAVLLAVVALVIALVLAAAG